MSTLAPLLHLVPWARASLGCAPTRPCLKAGDRRGRGREEGRRSCTSRPCRRPSPTAPAAPAGAERHGGAGAAAAGCHHGPAGLRQGHRVVPNSQALRPQASLQRGPAPRQHAAPHRYEPGGPARAGVRGCSALRRRAAALGAALALALPARPVTPELGAAPGRLAAAQPAAPSLAPLSSTLALGGALGAFYTASQCIHPDGTPHSGSPVGFPIEDPPEWDPHSGSPGSPGWNVHSGSPWMGTPAADLLASPGWGPPQQISPGPPGWTPPGRFTQMCPNRTPVAHPSFQAGPWIS